MKKQLILTKKPKKTLTFTKKPSRKINLKRLA